ncbi:hypothetical protein RQP46_010086 [Phenoliferia psychrophenolica]
MSSAEAKLHSIINNKETISEATAFEIFDALKPVSPEEVFGEWTGGPVETGHMTSKWCQDVNFAGKKFTSLNDVTPVWVYNDAGERVFYEPAGTARLREVKFRGVVSACDTKKLTSSRETDDKAPTMDYFRWVDENTILSAADNKNKPAETMGTFFFYLKRGLKA